MDTTIKSDNQTFRSAVSVLEVLPEESQKKVLNFSIELLQNDENNPFRPKSEEELLKRVDRALLQIEEGDYWDAEDVERELINKYGLDVSGDL